MKLPQTDYIQLFRDAWNITWKNKFLWWFGFFAVVGGAGGSYNYSFDPKNASDGEKEIVGKISEFISANFEWVVAGAMVLFLIFLVLFILGLIGKGALLKSAEKISKNEKTDYRSGFSEGKKYWKRIFILGFLLFIFWMAIIIIVATPIVFLFFQKAFVFGALALFLALILLIPLVFLSVSLKNYGALYVVLGGLRPVSALERAYELFLKNLSDSVIFSLFFIPLNIVAGFGIIFLALPVIIIFLIMGLAVYFLIGKIGAMMIAGIGIFVLLAGIIFLKSVWEVFAGVSWMLFFQKIASPKSEEMVAERVIEIKKEILPEIEPVKTAELEVKEK